jgi:cytochrome c556
MFSTKPQSRHPALRRILAVGLILTTAVSLVHTLRAAAPLRRARPPKFTKSIQDVFFPDAREKLTGPRPAAVPGQAPLATTRAESTAPASTPSAKGWSKWIAAEVVEDEIKAQQIELAAAVKNLNGFKGGDYQKARANLSVLAVMFAIAAEYDGQVRWQRQAAGIREQLARAGQNCKVGTDGSYTEAKARADDLQLLVRGGSVASPAAAADFTWPNVAARQPLMKRLEQAQQQTVTPLTANSGEFERHADRLAHEAQLIAALAEVISKEGYEFADDETYLGYAKAMQTSAVSVRDAALQQNYDEARKAAGELGKACTACHEGYRS